MTSREVTRFYLVTKSTLVTMTSREVTRFYLVTTLYEEVTRSQLYHFKSTLYHLKRSY